MPVYIDEILVPPYSPVGAQAVASGTKSSPTQHPPQQQQCAHLSTQEVLVTIKSNLKKKWKREKGEKAGVQRFVAIIWLLARAADRSIAQAGTGPSSQPTKRNRMDGGREGRKRWKPSWSPFSVHPRWNGWKVHVHKRWAWERVWPETYLLRSILSRDYSQANTEHWPVLKQLLHIISMQTLMEREKLDLSTFSTNKLACCSLDRTHTKKSGSLETVPWSSIESEDSWSIVS